MTFPDCAKSFGLLGYAYGFDPPDRTVLKLID